MIGKLMEYQKASDLERKVDDYFNDVLVREVRPTMSGLAYFLGFMDVPVLEKYEKVEEFVGIIKRAKLRIKMWCEEQLVGTNGAHLTLKSMETGSYTDKVNIEHSGEVKLPIQFILSDKEDADKLSEKLGTKKLHTVEG